MTAEDLRIIRQSLGWSQQRLADEIGVSRTTVKYWECGLRQMTESHDRLVRLVAEREGYEASRI